MHLLSTILYESGLRTMHDTFSSIAQKTYSVKFMYRTTCNFNNTTKKEFVGKLIDFKETRKKTVKSRQYGTNGVINLENYL